MNAHESVLEEIKTFNCCLNMCLAEFGSLPTFVKNKLYHQFVCSMCGSQLWLLRHENVNNMFCRK